MDLAALNLFAEIARLGSFAAAAKARGIEPSSASRIVASLEASLGFRLFQRSTRKLALSEAGALYLARVTDLLAGLEAAREPPAIAAQDPRGDRFFPRAVGEGARGLSNIVECCRLEDGKGRASLGVKPKPEFVREL